MTQSLCCSHKGLPRSRCIKISFISLRSLRQIFKQLFVKATETLCLKFLISHTAPTWAGPVNTVIVPTKGYAERDMSSLSASPRASCLEITRREALAVRQGQPFLVYALFFAHPLPGNDYGCFRGSPVPRDAGVRSVCHRPINAGASPLSSPSTRSPLSRTRINELAID